MITRNVCCVFVSIFVIFGLVRGQADDLCTTPRNKQGECKTITVCASLYAILQKRPISAADADYLRSSQCGFEGTLPKVCCPFNDGAAQTTATTTTSSPINNVPSDKTNLLPDLTVCGVATQNRIYGGEKADLDEFPWMALVEYERPNGQRGFYCGGVLINKRYILTAAHCVKGKDLPKDWKLVSVRLGEYNTETDEDCINNGYVNECAPPPLNIAVQERIAHEDYVPVDPNQYHDIALLRLSRDVPYSDYVKPICVPTTPEEINKNYAGQKLNVAGWGKTETRSESNIKLKLEVPVKTNAQCSTRYSAASVKLGDGQICAGGERGRDSCRGDSGGPLMAIAADRKTGDVNWFAVGIVSFGPSPCGMENWPGVYTSVAKYSNWIVSKLKP